MPGVRRLRHLRHRWVTIEEIGRVMTQRCELCGKTRVRIR